MHLDLFCYLLETMHDLLTKDSEFWLEQMIRFGVVPRIDAIVNQWQQVGHLFGLQMCCSYSNVGINEIKPTQFNATFAIIYSAIGGNLL